MHNYIEPKKILCIHDLSVFGRCSLSVIAPVLSAMGCQAIPLPTVVLSTHTGGLGKPASLQDPSFGQAALEHYAALGITFDCIYTGYLADESGVALAERAFTLYPNAYKIVDPVMGDHGKAYTSITPALMEAMRTLCTKADLILPNYTEAHLLLAKTYPEQAPTKEGAEELAQALTTLSENVLITGVPLETQIGCAGAGREEFWVQTKRLDRNFPGTGDLYGAVLIGAYLGGNALSAAAGTAASFIGAAIQNTPPEADTRFGVYFEPILYQLTERDHPHG